MILVGLLILFGNGALFLIGLICISLGSWLIYNTYRRNQDTSEYLVLDLNCEKDIYLYCKQHTFAIELMDVIINCINSGKEYRISMDNCKIEACQFGDGNLMKGVQ